MVAVGNGRSRHSYLLADGQLGYPFYEGRLTMNTLITDLIIKQAARAAIPDAVRHARAMIGFAALLIAIRDA